MTVTFTMMARIQLTGLLRQKFAGLSIDDMNRKVARCILLKIRPTPEESTQYEKEGPDGRGLVNLRKIQEMPTLAIDLDPKEIEMVRNEIKKGQWGPEDDDWFEPLLQQLGSTSQ